MKIRVQRSDGKIETIILRVGKYDVIEGSHQNRVTTEFTSDFRFDQYFTKDGHYDGWGGAVCCDEQTAHETIDAMEQNRQIEKSVDQLFDKQWRCFHCDEVFTDEREAMQHFGKSEHREAACQVDVTRLRELEDQLRAYHNEDTDLYRQMARLQSDHATALRREEEIGYARGIKDYRRLEDAANEVLRVYMPQFTDSRAVDDCLVGLAAAVSGRGK
jgi:hypothetical protein